jgi:hypothetical protein
MTDSDKYTVECKFRLVWLIRFTYSHLIQSNYSAKREGQLAPGSTHLYSADHSARRSNPTTTTGLPTPPTSPERAPNASHFPWQRIGDSSLTSLSSPNLRTPTSFLPDVSPISKHVLPSNYPDPRVPPQLNYSNSPYCPVPLPSPPHQIYLHTLLQRSETPRIIWDIRSPIISASCTSNAGHGNWLQSCASSPGLRYLTIRSDIWDRPMMIFASNGAFVSIGDVLEAIHRSLRSVRRAVNAIDDHEGSEHVPINFGMSLLGRRDFDDRIIDPDHDRASSGGAGPRLTPSGQWMWGGLVESPTERHVWILLLV